MTTSRYTLLLLLLLAIHGSIQRPSTPASLAYRAAVVELHGTFHRNDSARTMNDNADKILDFIEQAARKEADIIVFPEMGLSALDLTERAELIPRTTLIPDPSENFNPCNNHSIPVHDTLRSIACAAKKNNIYVVVNLLEKEICLDTDCHGDGLFIYITSATMDRNGKIIARYRKAHLVDEYGTLDVIKKPELSTFHTDFGVTFGNIICFDILYEEPGLSLTRKLNVTDIVHTSGWFSSMPFLTTIQMEAGWAYAEDVNMLSAGYNHIEWGDSGSGIYAGRQGPITAVMPLDSRDELLIADVPKKHHRAAAATALKHNHEHHSRHANHDHHMHEEHHMHGEGHHMHDHEHHIHGKHHLHHVNHRGYHNTPNFQWRYETFDTVESKLIAEDGATVETLTHNGINCEFEVNVTNLSPPVTYRLLAYDGIHPIGNSIILGKMVCAIVQCANNTINSCGHMRDSLATFNSVKITASYLDNKRILMMPNTLATDLLPFKEWTFDLQKHEDHATTLISLTKPTPNLVTFGIWGRNFSSDISRSENQYFKSNIVSHASIIGPP